MNFYFPFLLITPSSNEKSILMIQLYYQEGAKSKELFLKFHDNHIEECKACFGIKVLNSNKVTGENA